MLSIGVALWRTADVANKRSSSLNTTIFINVEAFSIAFSALYFWIIRTVIFGSIIGVSQTENAIPRILNRFQNDLNHSQELKNKIPLPNIHPEDDEHPESHEKMKKRRARRRFYGGIYSWIPSNHKSQKKSDSHRNQWFLHCKQMEHLHDPANTQFAEEELRTLNAAAALGARSESFHMAVAHMTGVAMATARLSISPPVLPAALGARSKSLHMAIALIAVIAGAAVGFSISSLVPPGGFNCQHIGELAIVVAWLASAYLDTQLNKVFLIGGDTLTVSKWRVERKTLLFWTTFTKDLAFTLATLMGVVLTQWGVMNRCACYTNWGRKGLALPQMPDVDKILYERINLHYWLIAALGLAFQLLVVLGCVWWRCPLAFRVYIQRDDAQSNWPQWLRVMFNKIRRFFDFKRKRTATSSVELAEGQDESDVTVVSAEVFRERPPNQRAQHSREPLLPQKADSP
ncbi:hypothetical protein MMC21_006052 [Puttea exsequens]|nr:hypothetical protein [Puttea exsequens]